MQLSRKWQNAFSPRPAWYFAWNIHRRIIGCHPHLLGSRVTACRHVAHPTASVSSSTSHHQPHGSGRRREHPQARRNLTRPSRHALPRWIPRVRHMHVRSDAPTDGRQNRHHRPRQRIAELLCKFPTDRRHESLPLEPHTIERIFLFVTTKGSGQPAKIDYFLIVEMWKSLQIFE